MEKKFMEIYGDNLPTNLGSYANQECKRSTS